MKLVKATLTLVLILLVTLASGSVLARGGHSGGGHSGGGHFSGGHSGGGHFGGHRFIGPPVRYGVIVGAPAFFFYPPPPPYYYPPLAATSSAPVYIEQDDAQSASEQADGYWYYCAEAQAYYPYVNECPQGWQPVVPQAPGQ
jgi:hypothetical protein